MTVLVEEKVPVLFGVADGVAVRVKVGLFVAVDPGTGELVALGTGPTGV